MRSSYGHLSWHYVGPRKQRQFMLWLAIMLSPNGVILVNYKPLKWNLDQGFYGAAAASLGLTSVVDFEVNVA